MNRKLKDLLEDYKSWQSKEPRFPKYSSDNISVKILPGSEEVYIQNKIHSCIYFNLSLKEFENIIMFFKEYI